MDIINENLSKSVIQKNADLVIVGAGIPGVVHAIQAARLGVKCVLVNNRGYVGGNGSAEIAVCIAGATGQEFSYHARETGVIEELLLENLHRNPDGNRYIWDGVLMDAILAEKNIELFLNTNVDMADVEENKIVRVFGTQITTQKRYVFEAPMFVDNTGDGELGFLAGAEFRYGREGKKEFSEHFAPDEPDNFVLPSTLTFQARDMGHPVTYIPPKYALDLTKTDVLKYRVIPKDDFWNDQWFYELDGDLDQIGDAEVIIQDQRNLVYGIWDYIKNSGNYDAENYDLCYVSPIIGKRESRRIMGDHILIESDITCQKDFEDVVGYGGWTIDLHAVHGIYSTETPNRHIFLNGVYQIPYRCGYSKNIDNLFMDGRCISTSHVGFGTTRVMATLSTMAQANAVASYLCMKYSTTPRGIYEHHIEEMQQMLMRCDQYIVGKEYSEKENLASKAQVTVSSVKKLKITDMDGYIALEQDMSISMPLKKRMESMRLLLNIKQDTVIKYSAYAPQKKENYNPAVCLVQRTLSVEKTDGFEWVNLPLDVKANGTGNLFFVIYANEHVECGTSSMVLTGVVCSRCYPGIATHCIESNTFTPKTEVWARFHDRALCFEAGTDEEVFGKDNLINGYSRPYGGTNIWQSKQVEGEYFTLKFEDRQKLNKMVLIFDSNLDIRIYTTLGNPFRHVPTIVKDYNVLARDQAGGFIAVAEIRDNYQRINELDLQGIETDEIKVEFLETNGEKHVGVYSVRLYA